MLAEIDVNDIEQSVKGKITKFTALSDNREKLVNDGLKQIRTSRQDGRNETDKTKRRAESREREISRMERTYVIALTLDICRNDLIFWAHSEVRGYREKTRITTTTTTWCQKPRKTSDGVNGVASLGQPFRPFLVVFS